MQYMPVVGDLNRVGSVTLGENYTALVFDQIESLGEVDYTYLVCVFDDEKREPVYFVTSEVNMMAERLGGGSHFLGVFNGEGHLNLGASDDWSDLRKFSPQALQLASSFVGLDPDHDILVGSLYASRNEDGLYHINKVLVLDEHAIHLRLYANTFNELPASLHSTDLSLGRMGSPDGFGIGHFPLALEGFKRGEYSLVGREFVAYDELDGYRIWAGIDSIDDEVTDND